MKHQIYLIPGFFGFASIGGIAYFRQVRETLAAAFGARGEEVEIFGVKTLPSASQRDGRSAQLLKILPRARSNKRVP